MKFDDKTVAALVASAKDDKAKLTFYGTTFPWIFLALGFVAVATGTALLVTDRRKSTIA